jgi:hypothetical protein
MSRRSNIPLLIAVVLCAGLCLAALSSVSGQGMIDQAAIDLSMSKVDWDVDSISYSTADEVAEEINFEIDPHLEPAQAVVPRLSLDTRRRSVANNRTTAGRAAGSAAFVGMASVPYMIGDTGAGTCLGFQGLLQAQLSHPSLACARLNIAEANSAVPTDRFYYSYRHFHNASTISAYQFRETLNLDRYLLAWEHLCWDGMASFELRLPLEDRMRSDIFSIIAPGFGVVDPLVGPNGGRRVELGNIAGIFKYLLVERDWLAISAGLGITLPTAQDVEYNLAVAGEMEFANNPGLTADIAAAYQGIFANETIYLEPFLAWLVKEPASNWFHQGFLQVEVAANPSQVSFFGDGATLFSQNGVPIGFYDFFTPGPEQVDLFAQTLMRLNLGTGYLFVDNPQASGLKQLTALFEMHYTSTLQDANLSTIPLTVASSVGTVPLQDITVGNGKNRVDLLNVAMGVSMNHGGWIVTNGVVAPLRNEANRGFDFEYNMQIQRPF